MFCCWLEDCSKMKMLCLFPGESSNDQHRGYNSSTSDFDADEPNLEDYQHGDDERPNDSVAGPGAHRYPGADEQPDDLPER